LQPYIRTFDEAVTSVPDGICWSGSDHESVLEALCFYKIHPTPV